MQHIHFFCQRKWWFCTTSTLFAYRFLTVIFVFLLLFYVINLNKIPPKDTASIGFYTMQMLFEHMGEHR
jgi:hypothetical protein